MANDIGGIWRTVGGRRIFIKDGEDLETAMKNSGKFGNKKEENNNIELQPKWCEVSEEFEPEIRNRIIKQINELNKEYSEAFEQNAKLVVKPGNLGDKTFAVMYENGQMIINKKFIDDTKLLSEEYQKSVKENWNQRIPEGKELEGIFVHEFGHYYQNMQYQFSDLFEEYSLTEYSIKIQDDIHTDYVNENGVKDIDVSMYGFSSPREWYAEMFLQNYFYSDNEYAKNFYNKAIKGGK